MSDGGFRLSPDPFPPTVPEEATALPVAEDLDAIDAFVLGHLAEPRLFRIGRKRILRGRLAVPEDRRRHLRERLRALPVDAFFERVGGETFATVSRPKTRALPEGWPGNLALFLVTLFTTAWGGAYWNGVDPFAGSSLARLDLQAIGAGLARGLPFALSLLAILTCHEFGHFFAARRYGLDSTLPFYIPVPPFLSPIGTLGAVIKMNTPLYNRRILLDVGAAGPLAGLAVAIPILCYGILRAPTLPAADGAGLYFNEPLLFSGLEYVLRPDLRSGGDIQATSFVLAGWLGLFVTALNLLPVGQLDGGHIVYALLGRGQHAVGWGTFAALAGLGSVWSGWWAWVLLILLMVRVKHPPLLDVDLPLDGKRRGIGWLTVLLFGLCFHPAPFELRL